VWTNIDYCFIVSDVLEDFSLSEVGTKRRLKKSTTSTTTTCTDEANINEIILSSVIL